MSKKKTSKKSVKKKVTKKATKKKVGKKVNKKKVGKKVASKKAVSRVAVKTMPNNSWSVVLQTLNEILAVVKSLTPPGVQIDMPLAPESTPENGPDGVFDPFAVEQGEDAFANNVTYTKEDVMTALQTLSASKGLPFVSELLKKYNAARVSDISENDYDAVMNDCSNSDK